MDAKELRVGNWVIDGDGDENQVEEICPYSFGKNDFRWDWLKSVEPIPLTEDWLLKFGFDDLGYYGFGIGYFHILYIEDQKNNFQFPISNKYVRVKHVHQLQNLYFALTGKELKSAQIKKI
jgi:hypothetical protein